MRCCECEFRNQCDESETVLTAFVRCYKRDRLLEEKKAKTKADEVSQVVHGVPVIKKRPEKYERYDEYGLSENGEMLYVKRALVDEKSYAMYCPACGKRLCSRFINYCPNCGAKMVKEADHED